MIEVKDFLPEPEKLREWALSLEFKDLHSHEGETYKRIANVKIPGLQEAVEKVMGPVLMLGQGIRLNFNGEVPNHAVHTDVGWGSHALVYYLSRHPDPSVDTGTAFYKTTEGNELPETICHEEFGKAVIYRSDTPHSRWPLEAYGVDVSTGRLIAVAFFTPLSEL